MSNLAGKNAVVTGGSRGIGRAIVERLLRDGASVTFSYLRDADAAGEVAALGAHAVRSDLSMADEIPSLFDAAEAHGGGLDIVVNNAAVVAENLIVDTSDEEYDRVMGTNARGTFIALREAARRIRDHGRIVNISTLNTIERGPGISLYAASKAAIEQFTVVAAHELGSRGITVNAVAPGATETELLRGANPPEAIDAMIAETPLGRIGQPADIADVVSFLVGPDGGWMTGQVLFATGGVL